MENFWKSRKIKKGWCRSFITPKRLGKFAEENSSIVLNVLIVSYNSEEIKLAYKTNLNKRKTQVILLMINYEANNCYYFIVKNLSEKSSSEWLRVKKETIISSDNDF